MVTLNLPHGPYADDMRFAQIRESWKEAEEHFTAKSCVLFQQHSHRILEDRNDQVEVQADEDLDDALWRNVVEHDPFRHKGYRINLNRFFGGVRAAANDLPNWHATLLQLEYTALEHGLLASRKFEKIAMKGTSAAAAEFGSEKSTDPAKPCLADKALKSCCENALVISVAFRGDYMNNLIARIVVVGVDPTAVAWETEQGTAEQRRRYQVASQPTFRRVHQAYRGHARQSVQFREARVLQVRDW